MGKTARWFRGLLGGKTSGSEGKQVVKEKKRWGFMKSFRDKEQAPPNAVEEQRGSYREGGSTCLPSYTDGVDPNKHAIVVAAATAAVAEAAVAAAQAAAAVVRLTSSGRCPTVYLGAADVRKDWAAVKMQAAFRGYLARRAFRALKGLVKLQALVRGHLVRKHLRCMEAGVRAKGRPLTGRGHKKENRLASKSRQHHTRNTAKSKMETIDSERLQASGNWLDSWIDRRSWDQYGNLSKSCIVDDDNNDKILEGDPGKPHLNPERRIYPSSVEVQSQSSLRFSINVEESAFSTAENSSRQGSVNGGAFTPTKSDCSRSIFSGYSDYSNYMANTESSRAKVRSHSAPKQRPEFKKLSSTERFSVEGVEDGRSRAPSQKDSNLLMRFTSKAYPGSGRLDRLGMPIPGIGGHRGANPCPH